MRVGICTYFIVFLSMILRAQESPVPVFFDALNGREGMTSMDNRLWEAKMALSFSEGKTFLPMEQNLHLAMGDTGMTLAFWVYTCASDSGGIYYGYNAEGKQVFGASQKNNRLLVNMYHYLPDGTVSADVLWTWDTLKFAENYSWHYIVLAFSKDGTDIYLYQGETGAMCHSSFVLDARNILEWGLGCKDGKSVIGIDDICIYNRYLTAEEVGLLFETEKIIGFGPYTVTNCGNGKVLSCDGNTMWYLFARRTEDGAYFLSLQADNDEKNLVGNCDGVVCLMPNQKDRKLIWMMSRNMDGTFAIQNILSGLNMIAKADGTSVLKVDDGTDSQLWYIQEPGDNSLREPVVNLQQDDVERLSRIYYNRSNKSVMFDLYLMEEGTVKVGLYTADGMKCGEKEFMVSSNVINGAIPALSAGVNLVEVVQNGRTVLRRKVMVVN